MMMPYATAHMLAVCQAAELAAVTARRIFDNTAHFDVGFSHEEAAELRKMIEEQQKALDKYVQAWGA